MAGPMDLRGRVVVTDGATGTLRKIRGELDGIAAASKRLQVMQNAIVSGALAVRRSTAAVAGAVAGGYGMMAVLRKAEDFNRNIFGVGTAAISDNTSKVVDSATGLEKVVVNLDKVRAAMKEVEGVSLGLSRELGQTPTRISGIAEVLAKAGFDTEKLAAATKAIAIVSSTDLETPVAKLGEFASVLDTIYKPRDGEKWGEFFARQLDIVRIAAGETRLSVGSMMEGLRPFSALFAAMGNSAETNALMLMAGVKKGGEATEVGHTLKSSAVRFMRMTAEGATTFSSLGMKRGDYTDLSAMDPARAAGNLSRAFRTANIKGKFRAQIESEMQRALEKGTFDTPEFQNRLMNKIAKAGRVDMKNEQSRSLFEEKFMNAMFSSGMRVDMLKFMNDLVAKGATPAQIATILEGRRIGTIMQILEGLRDHQEEYKRKIGMAGGAGIDAVQQIYSESNYGKLQKFFALWEGFLINLGQSAGFEAFLGGITTAVNALGQMPKPLMDIASYAGAAAVMLTPIALGLMSLGAALKGLQWLAAAAGASGAAGAAAGAASGGAGSAAVAAAAAAAGGAGAMAGRSGVLDRLKRYGGAAARTGGYILPGIGQGMIIRDLARGGGALAGALRSGAFRAGMLVPGLGTIMGLAMLGMSVYSGYQKYQETGSVTEGLKEGSGFNDMMGLGKWLFGGTAANAAPAGATPGAGAAGPSSPDESLRSTVDRMRATLQSVDFTAEGQRIVESLAQGIRNGSAAVDAAIGDVAARMRSQINGVKLNTGPTMGAAAQ